MFQNKAHRTKLRVEVEIHLDDGRTMLAKVSIIPEQRVSDLMNDERQFLPIITSDGQAVILRKDTIAKVVPLDQHLGAEKRSDPYEVLGLSRNISDEDLAAAYRSICRQNHPDKIQASGMSAPFLSMAHSRMVRINDAYHRIVDARNKLRETETG